MVFRFSARIGLSLASLVLLLGPPTRHSIAEDQYVKVEIRGELRKGPSVGSQASAPYLLADGIRFELRFAKGAPPSPDLDPFYGKIVLVKGVLEQVGKGSQERLVCVVDGGLKAVDATNPAEAAEFLIGYRTGGQAAVTELSQNLGLKVLEHYKPGKYLRVQSGSGVPANFLEKLRDSESVRYVEPNATVRIPEGENNP